MVNCFFSLTFFFFMMDVENEGSPFENLFFVWTSEVHAGREGKKKERKKN